MNISHQRLSLKNLFRRYFIPIIVIFVIASLSQCTPHENTAMKINPSENVNDNPASFLIKNNYSDSIVNSAFPFTVHTKIYATVMKYTVLFMESGLAAGTLWSVNFNGTTKSSTIEKIVFSATNGTYIYSVNPVPGYSYVTPSSNEVTVNGSNVVQPVVFSKVTSLPPPHKQSSSPLVTSTDIYVILGVIIAVLIIGQVVPITIRRRK